MGLGLGHGRARSQFGLVLISVSLTQPSLASTKNKIEANKIAANKIFFLSIWLLTNSERKNRQIKYPYISIVKHFSHIFQVWRVRHTVAARFNNFLVALSPVLNLEKR